MMPTAEIQPDPPNTSAGLDAVILLAGGLRPSPLVQGTGISVLDLPLKQDQTVLEHWIEKLSRLVQEYNQVPEKAIVAYTANSPRPSLPKSPGRLPPFRFVCDQTGLRGPAGTARDICQHLEADANILLGEASRYLSGDLGQILKVHLESGADITVGRNPDGSPAGVYLTRRKALELIPPEGFIDLKEQWLRQAAGAGCRIRVVTCHEQPCQPLRTWQHFLHAIRSAHQPGEEFDVPLRFSQPTDAPLTNIIIQSPGSTVGKHAQIIDSVLMPGSLVDDGALIVRSYIGAGVHIHAGETIVDGMIQSPNNVTATPEPLSGFRNLIKKIKGNRS